MMMSTSGALYLVSEIYLGESYFQNSQIQFLKQRAKFLGKVEPELGTLTNEFVHFFEKALDIDQMNGDKYLSYVNAFKLRKQLPNPVVKG